MNHIYQQPPRRRDVAATDAGAKPSTQAPLARASAAVDASSSSVGRVLERAGTLAERAGASMRDAGRQLQEAGTPEVRRALGNAIRAQPTAVFVMGLGVGALAYRLLQPMRAHA